MQIDARQRMLWYLLPFLPFLGWGQHCFTPFTPTPIPSPSTASEASLWVFGLRLIVWLPQVHARLAAVSQCREAVRVWDCHEARYPLNAGPR